MKIKGLFHRNQGAGWYSDEQVGQYAETMIIMYYHHSDKSTRPTTPEYRSDAYWHDSTPVCDKYLKRKIVQENGFTLAEYNKILGKNYSADYLGSWDYRFVNKEGKIAYSPDTGNLSAQMGREAKSVLITEIYID